jgi:predicted ATP-dependent endonuclease of OLD family
MYLHSYRLKNYRRLQDVHVELGSDISIFVGANNSGKTSATQAIQMFLSGSEERFSLFDFSSHTWKILNALGEADPVNDSEASIPSISLDLWLEVSANDLYLVMPILPSSDWEGTQVGIRIEFAAANAQILLQRFREKRQEGLDRVVALSGGAGAYVPWPKNLTDYLAKELHREFEFKYFVLDRAQFNDEHEQNAGYVPAPLGVDQGGAAVLKSIIKVDSLSAQRHLADPSSQSSGAAGRSEDLSRRLSRFYQRNLKQRGEDHSALKALFESEEGLNRHLMEVFEPTLKRIATLGYPGLSNPKLEIKSGLNPTTVMSQDARVHYVLGDSADAVRLPDSYNGLGFKNLIYMVVEILDVQERWREEEEKRAPLHLIFIEEPEAHLHAQLQQVFIRNVLGLLKIAGEDDGVFVNQVAVTTHSPHILYEGGFDPIRYFRVKAKGSDPFVILLIAVSKRKEYQPYGSVLGVWQG